MKARRCMVSAGALEEARIEAAEGRHVEAIARLLRGRAFGEPGSGRDGAKVLAASQRALSLDAYACLGVAKGASEKEIRHAYKQLALLYHPDKNQGLTSELFETINASYQELLSTAGHAEVAARQRAADAAGGNKRVTFNFAEHQFLRPARTSAGPATMRPAGPKSAASDPLNVSSINATLSSPTTLEKIVASRPAALTPDEAWEEFYWKLANFKLANGHCYVPARLEADRRPQRLYDLGDWAVEQRIAHEHGKLPQSRRARLEAIGFNINDVDWRRRIDEPPPSPQKSTRNAKRGGKQRPPSLSLRVRTRRNYLPSADDVFPPTKPPAPESTFSCDGLTSSCVDVDDDSAQRARDFDASLFDFGAQHPPLPPKQQPEEPPADSEEPTTVPIEVSLFGHVFFKFQGIGSRFQKEGYLKPKPFVRVLGREMILWVVDSLNLEPEDTLVVVYNPKFLDMKVQVELVQLHVPGVILVEYRAVSHRAGASFVFHDKQPKPIYSYVTLAEGSQKITQIVEKVKISDWANTGCYCFKDGEVLLKYCGLIIERGETQLSQDQKGEFYTSGVIKAMLDDGEGFEALELGREDMQVLGTPAQVVEFCRSRTTVVQYRFCFDLDNTLFTAPRVAADYTTCEPIDRTIAMLKELHAMGHYIILHTARRMRTHQANVGAVVADIGAITLASLEKAHVPYHEVHFGKPWAQFYIDDHAVSAFADLDKELGYYAGMEATAEATYAAPARTPNKKPPPVASHLPYYVCAAVTAYAIATTVCLLVRKR